jgi:hypothetical protein
MLMNKEGYGVSGSENSLQVELAHDFSFSIIK